MKTTLIVAGLLLSPLTLAYALQASAAAPKPVSTGGATGQADGAAAACDCSPPGAKFNVNIPHDNEVTATHNSTEYSGTATGYPSGSTAQTSHVPCGKRKRIHYTFKNCEVDGEQLVCDTPASWTVKEEDC